MTSTLAFIAVGLLLLYFCWLAVLWRFQERIVFQPPARVAASNVSARQVRYSASDGAELFAYIVGDCAPSNTVIIAFHGNADIARWFVPWATRAAHETRACVVLPEYRGYDGLAGAPSYALSKLDALAALTLVRETLGVPADNVVYFGHSLGSAIAAELAVAYMPRRLILQSPFSSAREMAARMVLPGVTAFWRIMARVHFDTIARVRQVGCPVWVTHGELDMLVPARMGREVFGGAAHKGELLIVPGARHNDVPEMGGREYWDWLQRAVGTRVPRPATPAAPAGTQSAP